MAFLKLPPAALAQAQKAYRCDASARLGASLRCKLLKLHDSLRRELLVPLSELRGEELQGPLQDELEPLAIRRNR